MYNYANAADDIYIARFLAQVTSRIGGIVEMAYAGETAAATHTSSYRVKFRKNEFMDLVQMAQPSIIYHVRRMHFFAHNGLQTAAVKLDISGQFHCGLYIDQYDFDL